MDAFYEFKSATVRTRQHANYTKIYNLHSTSPGQGHATRLLEFVIFCASKEGVTLYLVAKEFSTNIRGMNNNQLMTFYKGLGFEHLPGTPEFVLIRKPSQKLHGL